MASSSLLVSPSVLFLSNSLPSRSITIRGKGRPNRVYAVNGTGPVEEDSNEKSVPLQEEEEIKDPGVKVALSVLKFYKREISPLLLNSCRYVPTCSEYSMQAYKKYGFVKGTVLATWRVCRCNPFGGTGFDPPYWFGEERKDHSSDP